VAAAYTKLNLADIEDQAPKFGLSPSIEFRLGREPLGLERSGVSYLRLAPGFRLPFGHSHREQEEVYVLVEGSARAKVGDDVVDLRQWDLLRVPKETVRSFEAGPEGAVFIAIGAPATPPGDAELVPGWWSD